MKSAFKHTALILLATLMCWPLLAKAERNVLILSSINNQVPWQGSLERGILERAQEIRLNDPHGEHAELYFASVDWFRKVPERSLDEIAEDVVNDFEGLNFDHVIVIGQPASHVFELAQQRLGNPVAEYVDTSWPSSFGLDSNALRQPERVYESLREIYPAIQRLIYLGNDPHSYRDEVGFDTRTEIEFLERSQFDSQDEWDTLLSELGAGDLVLVDSSMMRIGTDLHFPYQTVAEAAATTDVPILVTQSPLLALDGVLGGLVLNSHQLGRALADIAEGQTPDLSQLRQHVYNYSELERFGFTVAGLDGEVEIHGEPVYAISVEKVKGHLLLGFLGFALFGVAWLARERRRSRQIAAVAAENADLYRSLQQRQRSSEVALDAAGIAYYQYNHRNAEFSADERFLRLYGYSDNARANLDVLKDQIHPEDIERVLDFRSRAYSGKLDDAGETDYSVVYRIYHKQTGELVWLKAFARQFVIDGELLTLGCIFSIDAEMRAQQGYERIYQHLKAACEIGNLYIIETNLDSGDARYIIRPTQGETQPLSGEKLLNCVDSAYHDELKAVRNGLGVAVEFPLHYPGWDAPRWTREQVARRWIDDKGEEHIVVLCQDIHEEMEQRLDIERSQQLISAAAREAGVSLIDHNLTAHCAEWKFSAASEAKTPYIEDRLLQATPPEYRELVAQAHQCVGQLVEFPLLVAETGRTKWVQNQVFDRWLDIDGAEHQLVISKDLTDQHNKQLALEEALEQREEAVRALENKQQAQQQMFAVIGHELRTPAAALSMMLDSQQDELTEEELNALRYAKDINATARHLMDVLDDLRAVVEPESINFRTRDNATPLDVVEGCLTPLRDRLKTANLWVQLNSVQGAAEPFSFDAKGMRQIITNLVKNAAIHSGASELKLGLLLELNDEAQKQLRVELADNGKGIPKEQWESIFEPFERGDTEADGTGLGLHICREIARASGGELLLDASPDGGCRFTLLMPLEDIVEEPESKPISLAAADSLDGKSILFAEDNLTLRMLTEQILKGLKAQYRPAINGAEALAIAAEQDFDLVLTDIFMPEVDGFELVETLRKRGFNKPIIGITAAMVGDETERLLAAGADIVVPKPVTRDKLEAAWIEVQDARHSRT